MRIHFLHGHFSHFLLVLHDPVTESRIDVLFSVEDVSARAVKQIFSPLSLVLVIIYEFHHTVPVLVVVVKLALVGVPRRVFIQALAVFEATSELSFVEISIGKFVSALSLFLAIPPLALVDAVLEPINTSAIGSPIRPLAFILPQIDPAPDELPLHPLPRCHRPEPTVVDALPCRNPVPPLAHVLVPRCVAHLAAPLLHIPLPLPLIDIPIEIVHPPIAHLHALSNATLIALPIRIQVDPLPMMRIIGPSAHVNRAIGADQHAQTMALPLSSELTLEYGPVLIGEGLDGFVDQHAWIRVFEYSRTVGFAADVQPGGSFGVPRGRIVFGWGSASFDIVYCYRAAMGCGKNENMEFPGFCCRRNE